MFDGGSEEEAEEEQGESGGRGQELAPPTHELKAAESINKADSVTFRFNSATITLPTHQDQSALAFKVWRSSLVASVRLASQRTTSADHPAASLAASLSSAVLADAFAGKEVLELGCGCALAGLLVGQLGASCVVLTDCKDDALAVLLEQVKHPLLTDRGCKYEVQHLLWQQDKLAYDHACVAGSLVKSQPPEDYHTRLLEAAAFPELQHWCNASRDPTIPALTPTRQFDLIIAADCLYFADQESGLVASFLLRLRRPHGVGMVVFQPRNRNAACMVRLVAALRTAGMAVQHEKGPWCHEEMAQEHMCGVLGVGGASQEDMTVWSTNNEDGSMEMLTLTWE
eukprot:gene31152-6294_t